MLLDDALRADAMKAVHFVADRLRDLNKFKEEAIESWLGTAVPWRSSDLATGYCGPAILFSALAHITDDDQYRRAAFDFLSAAVREESGGFGLYGGGAGLLAAARYCSEGGRYYKTLVERLSIDVGQRVTSFIEATGAPATTYEFDLVGGVSGTALALGLAAPPAVLDYLLWLLQEPSRWFVPIPGGTDEPKHNLGMAHGLAGILAGVSVIGGSQHPIVREAVRFMMQSGTVLSDNTLVYGTAADEPPPQHGPYNAAWCYGTMGVGIALLETALSANDDANHFAASQTLQYMARSTPDGIYLTDAGLCHGAVGTALMFRQYARLSGDESASRACTTLVRDALSMFSEEHRFGFRTPMGVDDGNGSFQTEHKDINGFLTGACGIALGLATLTHDIDDSWLTLCLGLPSTTKNDLGISPAERRIVL